MGSHLKNVLTVAAGVLLALSIVFSGMYFWWYSATGPNSEYGKSMQKMLDDMNAENARIGLPPIKVGN